MLPTSSTSKPVPAWAKSTDGGPSAIDRLFARLSTMYMQRWRASFPTTESIDAWANDWAEALSRHGITPHQAFGALQALELMGARPVPTLPEFLALCQPARMDYREAYLHAARNLELRADGGGDVWPDPAVYWAAQDVGPYDMRTLSYSQLEAMWRRCLDRRRASECPEVPPMRPTLPMPAVNGQGKAVSSSEARTETHKAINSLVRKQPSGKLAVERARRFIEDAEAGKPVGLAQLEWARAVVGRLYHLEENEDAGTGVRPS